jgi:hypothetical protein
MDPGPVYFVLAVFFFTAIAAILAFAGTGN